ncbi:ribosome recycling factor [Babesia caballi]|uniref:Ribosome recycling factor n=1 Tax=Babesia caballi TaxID=5871 RepID=A0AAV4M0V6_BABCB|nr:ribosome recycling factor [Babesia caballi]
MARPGPPLCLVAAAAAVLCLGALDALGMSSSARVPAFLSWRGVAQPRLMRPMGAGGKKKGRRREDRDDSDEDGGEPGAVSQAELEAVFATLRGKIKDAEEFLGAKISRLALHRATPSMLESLTVELPGESREKRLQHVGRIMSKGPYELHVVPFAPGHLDAVFVGLSTKLVDYKVTMLPDRVSVVVPSMTEAMVRQARAVVKETQNEVKAQVRTARQATLKKLKRMHEGLSDDMYYRQQKEVDAEVKKGEQRLDQVANDALPRRLVGRHYVHSVHGGCEYDPLVFVEYLDLVDIGVDQVPLVQLGRCRVSSLRGAHGYAEDAVNQQRHPLRRYPGDLPCVALVAGSGRPTEHVPVLGREQEHPEGDAQGEYAEAVPVGDVARLVELANLAAAQPDASEVLIVPEGSLLPSAALLTHCMRKLERYE